MKTLPLREWTTTPGLPLTSAQRDLLRMQFAARVEPTVGLDGRYDVTPTHTIGAIVASDTVIVIQPKIPIARVMFLLSYSIDPSTWNDNDWAALADAPDVVTGMATLYVRLTAKTLRRGMLAGYHPTSDLLHTVRGRINLAEQLRRRPGRDLPLAVEWHEYDEDVTENRILLAAAHLLQLLPINDHEVRQNLRRVTETMQHVTPVHYPPHRVPDIIWTRLNVHYRPAVELARLLLQGSSVDLAGARLSTPALTINMARAFEHFVRVALREALPATEADFPAGATAPPIPFDVGGAVRLEPDLSYWSDGRCMFIGDVKYKRDRGTGQSADLYQLLAYATASRLKQAMLLYADGPTSPRTMPVRGSNVVIRLHHLDLSAPPPQLLAQIQALATIIRGEANGMATRNDA